MKNKMLATSIITIIFLSGSANAISQADKNEMISLMKDSEPYIVGMGKSAFQVCQDMATDMVNKYGNELSKLGDPPTKIRESASGICFDAVSAAESSQSPDEVEMWKNSAMENIKQTFQGDTSTPSPKAFLTESVDHSTKIARVIAFGMEMNRENVPSASH